MVRLLSRALRRAGGPAGERGQAPIAIVVMTSLLLMAVGVSFMLRLATAEDQARGLQTAADAAALAGAEQVKTEAPIALLVAINARTVPMPMMDEARAAQLASENDAMLVFYFYDSITDRVTVRVRSLEPMESGEYEEATAVAQLGKRLGPCIDVSTTESMCGELSLPVITYNGVKFWGPRYELKIKELKARLRE